MSHNLPFLTDVIVPYLNPYFRPTLLQNTSVLFQMLKTQSIQHCYCRMMNYEKKFKRVMKNLSLPCLLYVW